MDVFKIYTVLLCPWVMHLEEEEKEKKEKEKKKNEKKKKNYW